jgi:hypothetical protein
MAPTQGERIVALETWQENHERRCEERLGEIKALVARTDASVAKADGNIEKLQGLVTSLIIAVAGGAITIVVGVILYATKLVG